MNSTPLCVYTFYEGVIYAHTIPGTVFKVAAAAPYGIAAHILHRHGYRFV